jgi:hypothetical protein
MLESVESLVDRIAEARKRKLSRLIDEFQLTPDDDKAHKQWKEIEKMIFGVDFDAAHSGNTSKIGREQEGSPKKTC